MKTVIFMVRHAESPFRFGQERTRKLSKQGELDAKLITDIMGKENIDIMVSSPYIRAIQTIEGLSSNNKLEIQVFEELKERPLKGNYKLPDEERQTAIKRSFDDLDYCLPGGETIKQAQTRVIPLIQKLLSKYEGKNIVIGTHGIIMTAILNYYDKKYGYDFWNSTTKPDIYKLTFLENKIQSVKRLWKLVDNPLFLQ
ncbi:histidine phosphatase family protein [Chengkuizengella axinellae]|uniref:Histidine phosphatase family protein n=1 Tax=Chengkuizengella axinellae TaxID=3064388 RepID=A0ABT9J559_9BACL|nr:histidine phosphatase family protein [Chengkuizengella sp. 2205SS18-9]MDP5276754.1 histidine phosphatase family protein [Chengkuizengella sp. 2205SS18-9]